MLDYQSVRRKPQILAIQAIATLAVIVLFTLTYHLYPINRWGCDAELSDPDCESTYGVMKVVISDEYPNGAGSWAYSMGAWGLLIIGLALGYGLGQFVGEINGIPYLTFLATGIICSSAVLTAAFSSFYECYVRMVLQKTWSAMLTTPLQVKDIVLGEVIWTGTKGIMNVGAILIVAKLFGLYNTWQALLVTVSEMRRK